MVPYDIRIIGDPALRQRADEVEDIDGMLVRIADRMLPTMYDAGGIGLAAPQVGIQKRLFVWDLGNQPRAIVNPEIVESDGEWGFTEGCLSVPGLSWEIVRPKRVHVVGRDLDGNEMSVEADELEARLFLHELDHLNGILLVERLDSETRKKALRTLRERGVGPGSQTSPQSPQQRSPTERTVPRHLRFRRSRGGRSALAVSAVSGRLAISRIVYFGTPRVAVPPLRALHTSRLSGDAGGDPAPEAPNPPRRSDSHPCRRSGE